jgi:hypothetical protein
MQAIRDFQWLSFHTAENVMVGLWGSTKAKENILFCTIVKEMIFAQLNPAF